MITSPALSDSNQLAKKAKPAFNKAPVRTMSENIRKQSIMALVAIWVAGCLAFVMLYFSFFKQLNCPPSNFKRISPNVLINRRHNNYLSDTDKEKSSVEIKQIEQ